MNESRSPQQIEAELERMLAEAEATAARLRTELASLRAHQPEPEDFDAVEAAQHLEAEHLDRYMQEATVNWRKLLEFFEEALAEIRRPRSTTESDPADQPSTPEEDSDA